MPPDFPGERHPGLEKPQYFDQVWVFIFPFFYHPVFYCSVMFFKGLIGHQFGDFTDQLRTLKMNHYVT